MDSLAVGDTVGYESEPESNPDGDIFMSDSLAAIIGAPQEWDKPDSVEAYEPDEYRTEIHAADLDVAGFSSDGKYFVFSQVWREDNLVVKGGVYIVEVATNEWASKPALVAYENDEGRERTRKSVAAKLDSVLRKYSMTYHGNMGYVFSFADINPNDAILLNYERATVHLKVDGKLIEVSVKTPDQTMILQKDKKVPASRGDVRRYRLYSASVLDGKIAVFVEYDGNVVETPENSRYYNRKYIVVTGYVTK